MKYNSIVEKTPEAFSIFINQIVYDKKAKGERVYTYSLGEAFFDIPRFNMSDEEFFKGYHYSGSLGQPLLRQKICSMYKKFYGVDVNPNTECLISAGSKVLIYMLIQTVINVGDEVIYHEPAWLSYKEQIRFAGGIPVAIPYNVEVRDWEKYITNKTKIIIINNPNNPSGQLYSENELKHLYDLAKKYDLFVLSDEAYSDFLLTNDKFISFANIDKTKENCLVVNSLSKNMGMSGWRIGYAIAHQETIKRLLKLNQHLITCAPTVLQDYIAKFYDDILNITLPQAVDLAKKRFEVQKILEAKNIGFLKGIGTFYFMLDVSKFVGTTLNLVYELLFNHNIATVPGEAYGTSTSKFIRFGIGVESLEDISKSLDVINELLDYKNYDTSKLKENINKYGYDIVL